MTFRQVTGFTAAVLLGAALLIPATASAQATTVGVKGGLNTSNVSLDSPSGESLPNTDTLNGLIIGGFVGKDFNPKAGMLVEFLYARAGTKFNDSDGLGNTATEQVKVDYFQIPVLGRANFKASDKAVVHVFGGPTFAFKASDTTKLEVNGVETPLDPADEPNLKGNDVGLTLGAGFTMNRFTVDLRYTWGLMNINKDSGNGEPEAKTKQFAVMFGMELWKK
jgi:Outer membrane protein beta-barrel domain